MGMSKEQQEDSEWQDRYLLQLVQQEYLELRELAEELPLSVAAIAKRLARLKSEGVITKTAAILDRGKVGIRHDDVVLVKLRAGSTADDFASALEESPAIYFVQEVVGEYSVLLHMASPDVRTRNKALRLVESQPGVIDVKVLQRGRVLENDGVPVFKVARPATSPAAP